MKIIDKKYRKFIKTWEIDFIFIYIFHKTIFPRSLKFNKNMKRINKI